MGISESIKSVFIKPKGLAAHPDARKRQRRFEALSEPHIKYNELTASEKEELKSLRQEFGNKPEYQPEIRKSDEQRISDEYIWKKYGHEREHGGGIIHAVDRFGQRVGLLREPEDEWLENKRIEEEEKRSEREAYRQARVQVKGEEGAERGMGRRRVEAMRKSEEALMRRQQAIEEAKYMQEMLKVKREEAKIARIMGGRQPQQEQRQPQYGGLSGMRYEVLPYAGLEKFMAPSGSGSSFGIPRQGGLDFSRFVNPDPTAGLSKLWGQQRPQQQERSYSKRRTHKRGKK